MRAQLGRLPEWFEYYGAIVRTHEGRTTPFLGPYLNYVQDMPLGAVAQITPWNHPLLIAVKKLAPALAAGNSVVLKPSELAPVAVLELARIFKEAGLPDGVLSVLPGLGPEAGAAMCSHDLVRKVDLTGGTPTGRKVGAAAGANLASVVSELGGKAPMIVFPDADLDQVVNGAAFASFVASGQTCIMGARLLVHESIYDDVVGRFVAKAESIQLGDPMETATQMGPVVSEAQMQRVLDYVDIAKAEGARILTGGKAPPAGSLPDEVANGYYVEPTIIAAKPGMRCVQEEVFGPYVVCYPFKDEADAIRLANDSPFGLAAAIWTRDVARGHRVASEMDVGIVWINDHHRNDPSSPWGGTKDSGIGRENGLEAFREYTQSRSVVVRMSDEKFDWFEDPNARYS
uniref:Aldehyde dehydrogenase domain-containing protein n=1 Tax=Phaeomonas parva TaxID=124430 RepID=A0A7S1TQ26_9STRA|mmetsp:Transcript_11361/g.34420  ORF Transcript_11361/g.34420 Transcript_11361/m.34420 type:complete len:401 (+) Transcript_11361:363-1565(+)